MGESLLVLYTDDKEYNLVFPGDHLTPSVGFPIQDLFLDDARLKNVLQLIHQQVENFIPDTKSAKGRAEIKSLAAKVASSKVLLDDLGKDAVADLKKKPALIDAARKMAREDLDALKVKVRLPLTEWEKEREADKAKKAAAAQYVVDWDAAIAEDVHRATEAELKRTREALAKEKAESVERQRIADLTAKIAVEATREAERSAADAASGRAAGAIMGGAIANGCNVACVTKFGQEHTEVPPSIEPMIAGTVPRPEVSNERKGQVNKAIHGKLVDLGVDVNIAYKVVIAMARGQVENVKIEY